MLVSLLEPFSDMYVPKSDTTDFPKVSTNLRNKVNIINLCVPHLKKLPTSLATCVPILRLLAQDNKQITEEWFIL